jgi:hypothetical protein
MKRTLVIIILAVAVQGNAQSSLSKLEWLIGSWSRTNVKPGRSGIEIWMKKSNDEFVGKGINLRGTDTTFVEKLKLISREDKIYYVADVPQNKEPVLFELTSQNGTSITFENPKHDFPKKITYELNGNQLKATISGDGKSIDYWFERK